MAEDLCLKMVMDRYGIPFYDGCSNRFLTAMGKRISRLEESVECPAIIRPKNGSRVGIVPGYVKDAVTIHMHAIKMDLWTSYALAAGEYASVLTWSRFGWLNPPFFCKIIPPRRPVE
jgi:hypothetical protein